MSWERAELDWQMALWESTPAPWPEHVLLPWLRYVDGCLLRGARYYVPERCCGQVRKAASLAEVPGRRAIREVSGCPEWDARRYRDALAETDPAKCIEPWRDPYRRRADPADRVRELEAELAELRAGFSRVPPASLPPTSRVAAEESAFDRGAPPAPLPPLSRVPPDRALTPRASTGSPDHTDPEGGGDSASPTASDSTPEQSRGKPPDLPTLLGGDATLYAPLLGAEIASVEALTSQTMKAVRMLDGIGPRRILAIRDALHAHGLDFRAEPTKGRKPTTERPGIRDLTDRWCAAYLRSTGAAYVWTPGGQTSDNRAAQQVYDAVGWSVEPSEAAVAAAGGVVRRYLKFCAGAGRTPTLYDLARGLSRWMQDERATGPPRQAERLAPAVIADRARVAAIARLLPPSTPSQELDHEPSPRPLALVR